MSIDLDLFFIGFQVKLHFYKNANFSSKLKDIKKPLFTSDSASKMKLIVHRLGAYGLNWRSEKGTQLDNLYYLRITFEKIQTKTVSNVEVEEVQITQLGPLSDLQFKSATSCR